MSAIIVIFTSRCQSIRTTDHSMEYLNHQLYCSDYIFVNKQDSSSGIIGLLLNSFGFCKSLHSYFFCFMTPNIFSFPLRIQISQLCRSKIFYINQNCSSVQLYFSSVETGVILNTKFSLRIWSLVYHILL